MSVNLSESLKALVRMSRRMVKTTVPSCDMLEVIGLLGSRRLLTCLLLSCTLIPPPISFLQVSQKEKEAPLQKRLDEISEELLNSQASCQTLQKELDKAKEQQPSLAGEVMWCM